MGLFLKGLLTGGIGFITEWFKTKQEVARTELEIKKEHARTINQMKLDTLKSELDGDAERIRQMDRSWRDEWFTIIFSLPLVAMFISPFVDLWMSGQYHAGRLAQAASQALQNLDNAPPWYIFVVLMMVFLSYGYRKGFEKLMDFKGFFKK